VNSLDASIQIVVAAAMKTLNPSVLSRAEVPACRISGCDSLRSRASLCMKKDNDVLDRSNSLQMALKPSNRMNS
jgi:hypothetical protein